MAARFWITFIIPTIFYLLIFFSWIARVEAIIVGSPKFIHFRRNKHLLNLWLFTSKNHFLINLSSHLCQEISYNHMDRSIKAYTLGQRWSILKLLQGQIYFSTMQRNYLLKKRDEFFFQRASEPNWSKEEIMKKIMWQWQTMWNL